MKFMKLRRALAGLIIMGSSLLLLGGNYSGTLTVTTSGTARALSAATPAPPTSCVSLSITALTSNSGTMYIGGSNVSAANKIGVFINSTFPTAYFSPAVNNALYAPSQIWIDGTVSGDKVSYGCYK